MIRHTIDARRGLLEQTGQAMTEYIVLVVALFIGLIPILGALQMTLEQHYAFIATWISLPLP
jgi:Flp pilus assembly pilin Flp